MFSIKLLGDALTIDQLCPQRQWAFLFGFGNLRYPNCPTPQPGWTLREFSYDASHSHAVASVSENLTPAASYVYDANGNMTCRIENGVTFKQVYNTENRISSIMKLVQGTCSDQNPMLSMKWDFAYDGDGVRSAH